MKLLLILVSCLLQRTLGIIFTLNETEYDRMPRFSQLDEFEPCQRRPGDVYCYVTAKLVFEDTHELATMIQEYSAADATHYDHNYIQRGICVAKTCKDFLGNSSDLDWTLEACLNSSMTKSHQMQTKLLKDQKFCYSTEDTVNLDAGDVILAIVFVIIIMLNAVGSVYDSHFDVGKTTVVGRVLVCFSVKRNWQRLTMPSSEGPDPRLKRLKSFNGVKALNTFIVILGHSILFAVFNGSNPQFIESTYRNPIFMVAYNGSIFVQSFFMMSGFLLAFNILIMEEKMKMNWTTLPKGVLMRWLRLTPAYALMLAFVSTWLRHFSGGPLWKQIVGQETENCRREWIYHLLYVNNYVENSNCMLHAWYIAADMQLSVLGLIIFCLLTSPRARKLCILAACLLGLTTLVVPVYLEDLYPILRITPEFTRQYFKNDATFNHLYKPGHTNILCYAMGLYFGMVVYDLMKNKFDGTKLKKYVVLYWCLLPLSYLLALSGTALFMQDAPTPLALRVVYSGASKLLFGVLGLLLATGFLFKLENVCRGIIEWKGWTTMSRVSYCTYLVHFSIIRATAARHTSLVNYSYLYMFHNFFGIVVTSYLIAVPFWILVEAPFWKLVKVGFSPGSVEDSKEKPNGTIMTNGTVLDERL